MSQLALPLRLDDHAVFSSFLPVGNEMLVGLLQGVATNRNDPGCWIWGAPSVGKTHLLQAVCELAGDESVYVPIGSFAALGPDVLEGPESRTLVCLDDLERVAGDEAWERALFSLFNAIYAQDGRLVVAAAMAPRECPIRLPDLASRMSQLPIYNVHALDENDRATALKLRASHRGLELPDDTARYLLNRSRRDMTSLYQLLDQLDREALRAQRRLTIPFVREVLDSDSPSASV